MNNSELHARTALLLTKAAAGLNDHKSVVGFDGFVDEIIRAVDKRQSQNEYSTIPTLAKLAARIAEAAGKSTNVELVVQKMKLGGNGPIMGNALAAFGLQVTYIGNLGYPNLHPVFVDFAKRAHVISIAEPGHTDALEFEDGKLMLGKLEPLNEITYENLVQRVGDEQLKNLFNEAGLVGLVNWTMIPAMNDIWKNLHEKNFPQLSQEKKRIVFFDLADPAKRLPADIRAALEWISRFQKYFKVILGLNEKESFEIAKVLGLHPKDNSMQALEALAVELRNKLNVHIVVVHPVPFACAASTETSAAVAGPFDPKPLISTGAGDHFNAGFCLGNLLGLDLEASLLTGVTTSGFYVRTGKSPAVSDLVHFLKNWPA
jgi:sugar/nucleoside kinase (ribokinase family)